ncbi:MAG: TIGR00730 family Rossman fold protein, partial [Gammaproteobacteria bacterium]|nr:TIGR00730 family Rossman fold protein [Gammaproteobacteria bacterium]
PGKNASYLKAAASLGSLLADRGIGLVYGGGRVGLMGAVADAALKKGGEVIGVIPEFLCRKEVAHQGVQDMRVVNSMHERKALMADLSDAFVALPGGFGTLEELLEISTWTQLGVHAKPCGLLNVAGYYDGLLQQLTHAVEEQFIKPAHANLVQIAESAEDMLDRLKTYAPSDLAHWMDSAGT